MDWKHSLNIDWERNLGCREVGDIRGYETGRFEMSIVSNFILLFWVRSLNSDCSIRARYFDKVRPN